MDRTRTVRMVVLLKPSGDGKDDFTVEIPGKGTPDFHIRHANPTEAKEALRDYIYNELDGRGDIDLEDN